MVIDIKISKNSQNDKSFYRSILSHLYQGVCKKKLIPWYYN